MSSPLLCLLLVSPPSFSCHGVSFQSFRWSSWLAFPPNSAVGVLGCRVISPLIVVVVVVLPLLLLLLLLLFLIISPPFLLVVSPPFLLVVLGHFPCFPHSPPHPSCFSSLIISPSSSSPFPLLSPVVSLLHVVSPACCCPAGCCPAGCHITDSEHEPRQTSWLVFRDSTGASHSSSSLPGIVDLCRH